MFNSKHFFETFEIVNETPLIEIDAFCSRNLLNFLSLNSNFKIHALSFKIFF